jgi:CheY-like chemotaxis protein
MLPTVLVVEDDVLIRLVIADYLRECGYRVIEANNADEAMQVMRKPEWPIDVVFSDVQMPGSMDGFGLAQWVRREHPAIKVVLTSGIAKASDGAANLCDEGPLVAKPYGAADVERRIRQLLDGR